MKKDAFLKHFHTLARLSFVLICLVIVAGSVVRASGAGMGCPDWPLCFGRLIPPLSEADLPSDYREHYAIDGRSEEFNALKTWTELVNRWVGVLAGISLIALSIFSLRALRQDRSFFAMAVTVLLLTVAEGLLGALVVASYLQPIIVTLHLVLAIIIAAVLLRFVLHLRATRQLLAATELQSSAPISAEQAGPALNLQAIVPHSPWSRPLKFSFWLLFVLSIFQVIYGTQVREAHDAATWNNEPTAINAWLAASEWFYQFHAIVAVLVVIVSIALFFQLRTRWHEFSAIKVAPEKKAAFLQRHGAEPAYAWVLLGISILQTMLGFLMYFLGVPEWPKPIHLWLAIAVLLLQMAMFWLYIRPLPGRRF